MSKTVELKVRFNPESNEIEVVADDTVIGSVEKEIWGTWPLAEPDNSKIEALEAEVDEWRSKYYVERDKEKVVPAPPATQEPAPVVEPVPEKVDEVPPAAE